VGWWSIVPPWELPLEYLGFLFGAFMLTDPVSAIFIASLLVLFILLLHFRNPRLLIVIFVVQAIAAWRLLRFRW
jgi:hypothetical protein